VAKVTLQRLAEKLRRFVEGLMKLGLIVLLIVAAAFLHGTDISSYLVWSVLFAPVVLLVLVWTVLRGGAQTTADFMKPARSFAGWMRNGCFFIALILLVFDLIYLAEFLFLSGNESSCTGCGAVRDFVP
jgi:hypothetical protein